MDKFHFLTHLRAKLWALPKEDAERTVEYYREMIEDRMEDGLSEEEAVADVGNIDEIVNNILADSPKAQPVPQPMVQPVKENRRLRWWEILLLVLGSPVWASLLIAVAAVAFSVWITLWSVVISLYAAAVSLAASVVGCILACFFMTEGSFGAILVALGAALVCAGLSILMFMLSNLSAKGMIALTKVTAKGIKRIFTRKEQVL